MSNINKLGNLNILDKKLIDIGDNFIDGSSFLPDLNIAKEIIDEAIKIFQSSENKQRELLQEFKNQKNDFIQKYQ